MPQLHLNLVFIAALFHYFSVGLFLRPCARVPPKNIQLVRRRGFNGNFLLRRWLRVHQDGILLLRGASIAVRSFVIFRVCVPSWVCRRTTMSQLLEQHKIYGCSHSLYFLILYMHCSFSPAVLHIYETESRYGLDMMCPCPSVPRCDPSIRDRNQQCTALNARSIKKGKSGLMLNTFGQHLTVTGERPDVDYSSAITQNLVAGKVFCQDTYLLDGILWVHEKTHSRRKYLSSLS